jgi:hypothetical protein
MGGEMLPVEEVFVGFKGSNARPEVGGVFVRFAGNDDVHGKSHAEKP